MEEKLTPLMKQYVQIKEENQDKVLFYRVGDFFEMFYDDAVEVSRLLNLTLTHRGQAPMCGIPFHAAKNYIKRLLDAGKKIAICEQIELPKDSRELAKREVVQVITPATVVEDDFLDSFSSSYIIAVHIHQKKIYCAYSDITIGEFKLREVAYEKNYTSLSNFISQIMPKEILVYEDDYFLDANLSSVLDSRGAMVTKLPASHYAIKQCFEMMCSHLGVQNLKAFGIESTSPLVSAGGALMRYLYDSSKCSLEQIQSYRIVTDEDCLEIDESSRRSLEIFNNTDDFSHSCTLFDAVNRTVTSSGARLLKQFLSFPLKDVSRITERQSYVERFVNDPDERKEIRKILSTVLDISRLNSRIVMNRSYPKDLIGVARSVLAFCEVVQSDYDFYGKLIPQSLGNEQLNAMMDLTNDITDAINDQHQGPFEEGCVIKDGYDKSLDELRGIKKNGKNLLNDYLVKIQEETGIPQIKLGYNKIIGHYLEVTKTHTSKVPSDFYRKQTLVNAERYTTDGLVEIETRILKSTDDAERRERQLYLEIVARAQKMSGSFLAIGEFLSLVDVYQGLAQCAVQHDYVKPQFSDDDELVIRNGRHAVVEQQLNVGKFVANSLEIDSPKTRFSLITGPNMAGKSTFLRQTALIVLLAQIGSYVPAESCVLSPCDRIFCRVGASDNLAKGESTFLVEMQEAANILRGATSRSLVIMDEIGRGTSTQDGMSLAYAMMQRLASMGCKTLFATHYHELTMFDLSDVTLLTLEVEQKGRDIVFVRKVVPGVAKSSYGIHVAKIAGVPRDVLQEAVRFQKKHFADYQLNSAQPDLFTTDEVIFADSPVLDEIREFDLSNSTPLQAMSFLQRLKDELDS